MRGEATLAELASRHGVPATQIAAWRKQLLEHAGEAFENGTPGLDDAERQIRDSRAPRWESSLWNAIFCQAHSVVSAYRAQNADRRGGRSYDHGQCELLDVCRSSLYYQPQPVSAADLALMRAIDELHLKHPFLGARRLAQLLKRGGRAVGRRHVGTLMRLMGIEAIYRKRRTSLLQKGHTTYPYLLSNVAIERPNQVCAADITYLPMAKRFAYLVAILDLYSRKVLSFRVSNAMSTDFCVEALEEALARCGAPEHRRIGEREPTYIPQEEAPIGRSIHRPTGGSAIAMECFICRLPHKSWNSQQTGDRTITSYG